MKEIGHKEPISIDGFFSYKESKETKIFNASSGMKSEIVYPSIRMFTLNSPMGKAMNQFTSWSISQRYGDHDDFPDMLAMFVKYYCEKEVQNNMVVLSRREFGLR